MAPPVAIMAAIRASRASGARRNRGGRRLMPAAIGKRTYGVERVGALTDGVCAIAMTLLVLELKIPRTVKGDAEQAIVDSLIDQTSEFAAWLISFILIARIWQELHSTMSALERCDTPLIVLNIASLGACSLVPFASALVGHFDESPASVIVFSAIMILNGALLAIVNGYVSRHPGLIRKDEMPARFRAKGRYYARSFALVGAISIALAFQHPLIGIAAWALEPLVALFRALRPSTQG
jgi:uncharacterized membrane protein